MAQIVLLVKNGTLFLLGLTLDPFPVDVTEYTAL